MNIKVGQYGRLRINNKIITPTSIKTDKVYYDTHYYCYKNYLTKVANTPQELIECGDIVFTELNPFPRFVFDVIKNDIIFGFNDKTISNKITKILTPHGKDFICQWEAE